MNTTIASPHADTQKFAWLQGLQLPTVVYHVDPDADEGETPDQYVLLSIKLAEGQSVTTDTPVELDPPFGRSFWTTAGTLLPAPRVTVQVTSQIEFTAAPNETLDELVETLRLNFKTAINQDLLTSDIEATLEDETIVTAKLLSGPDSLSSEQRQELAEKLTANWLEAAASTPDLIAEVARKGFAGFDNLTDQELLKEHRDVFDRAFMPDADETQ